MPSALTRSVSIFECVDLPVPSPPSNVMNRPRIVYVVPHIWRPALRPRCTVTARIGALHQAHDDEAKQAALPTRGPGRMLGRAKPGRPRSRESQPLQAGAEQAEHELGCSV